MVKDCYAEYFDYIANISADGGFLDTKRAQYAALFDRNFTYGVYPVNKWTYNYQLQPKSTYEDQRARVGRPDPKAALRARVRASFEASGGTYGSESVTADLRSGAGEPVSWRDLAAGDMATPVVASEKVVRAIMAEEGLVARKTLEVRRRARYSSYRGERGERPANLPLREDGTHEFSAPEPGLLAGPTSRRPSTASTAGRCAGGCRATPTRRSWSACSPT